MLHHNHSRNRVTHQATSFHSCPAMSTSTWKSPNIQNVVRSNDRPAWSFHWNSWIHSWHHLLPSHILCRHQLSKEQRPWKKVLQEIWHQDQWNPRYREQADEQHFRISRLYDGDHGGKTVQRERPHWSLLRSRQLSYFWLQLLFLRHCLYVHGFFYRTQGGGIDCCVLPFIIFNFQVTISAKEAMRFLMAKPMILLHHFFVPLVGFPLLMHYRGGSGDCLLGTR